MPTTGPVDIAKIERVHKRFLEENDNWLRNALQAAADRAAEYVETRSTFERQSGSRSLKSATKSKVIKVGGGRRLRLTWNKKHAEWIDKGTRPHVISVGEIGGGSGSTRGKALRFRGRDGRWVFRRRVFHPGTRPYRFGSLAIRVAHREFGRRMGDYIKIARFHF